MPKLDRAELERLVELSEKATQGEWAIYDSNSWRRFGLKEDYKEFLWPCVGHDGHPDMSGLNREDDLEFIAALVNFFRANYPALLELEQDARRYRWLREANLVDSHQVSMVTIDGMEEAFEDLDAAIDAKMREGE